MINKSFKSSEGFEKAEDFIKSTLEPDKSIYEYINFNTKENDDLMEPIKSIESDINKSKK